MVWLSGGVIWGLYKNANNVPMFWFDFLFLCAKMFCMGRDGGLVLFDLVGLSSVCWAGFE